MVATETRRVSVTLNNSSKERCEGKDDTDHTPEMGSFFSFIVGEYMSIVIHTCEPSLINIMITNVHYYILITHWVCK